MPQVFSNNATSTLSAGIGTGDTSIFIQPGHGSRFPTITAPDFSYSTLEDASGNVEIVKITAHTAASTTMTVVRAQQGTTARAYGIGDLFEMRLTAQEANTWEADIDALAVSLAALDAAKPNKSGSSYTGTHDFTGATINAGTVNMGAATASTPANGDSSTKVATTAFVAATAMSSSLPGQTGAENKSIFSKSGVASWGFESITPITGTSATVSAGQILALDGTGTRTNLLTYSEQFDNAAWNKQPNVTITPNSATSPDGTTTADTFTSASATTSCGMYAQITSANSITYTASIYAKAGTGSVIRFGISDQTEAAYAYYDFNLSLGTASIGAIVGSFSGYSCSITPLTNGWYRCSVTATTPISGATSVGFFVRMFAVANCYLWGAQLEQASSATPYIQSVASQGTAQGVGLTLATLADNDEFGIIVRNGLTTNTLDIGARTFFGPTGTITGVITLDAGIRSRRYKYTASNNGLELL